MLRLITVKRLCLDRMLDQNDVRRTAYLRVRSGTLGGLLLPSSEAVEARTVQQTTERTIKLLAKYVVAICTDQKCMRDAQTWDVCGWRPNPATRKRAGSQQAHGIYTVLTAPRSSLFNWPRLT